MRHACTDNLPVCFKPRLHQLKCQAVSPKKSLGQNFLRSQHILQRIADAANITPGEPVIEVGPGLGSLTQCLLDKQALVTVIEKDRRLIKDLTSNFPTVKVIEADVLKCDLDQLITTTLQGSGEGCKGRLKVVGNLPYYITQDFLHQLLPLGHVVSHAVLLLQEEAALRLTQKLPGAPDYRAMTVEVHHYSQPQCLFTVPRSEFSPVPKVNGVVVEFGLRQPADRLVADSEDFLRMVRQAFSTKRKMLRNSLQSLYTPESIAAAMETIGLSAEARPQQLSPDDYVRLYHALNKVIKAEGTINQFASVASEL